MLFENYNILTALFQSLITGYFTYFLIKSNDLLVFSSAKKEEKVAVVSFLSIFNWSVYWLVQRIIAQLYPKNSFEWITFLSAVISFCIVVVLGFFIFPQVLLFLFNQIDKHREKQGKLRFTRKPIRDSALDHPYAQYIYVFDFDNNYIASGYLNIYQYNTDEYNELLLYAPKEPEKRKSLEAVEQLFVNNDMNILLDYEKKIKLYIVPMHEAAGG